MKLAAAIVTALTLWSTAALADITGRYLVEGSTDGNPYRGTVTLSRTGDTYRVEWRVGEERYVGTGIGDERFLAVSFISAGQGGIALFGRSGDRWTGLWTFNGGRKLETETWTRAR